MSGLSGQSPTNRGYRNMSKNYRIKSLISNHSKLMQRNIRNLDESYADELLADDQAGIQI